MATAIVYIFEIVYLFINYCILALAQLNFFLFANTATETVIIIVTAKNS